MEDWPENPDHPGDLTTENPEVDKEMRNFKAGLLRADSRKLMVENLREAEQEILRYCQRKKFSKEISVLQRCEGVKRSSSLFKLNPVLQEGILRVGGRLSRATMPEESKRPAILDKDLHVAKLILREIHENLGHSGRNHVLSKLRFKYWIPGANSAMQRILSKCQVCRCSHGAAGQQQMADLLRDRVLPDEPPFTNTGVDYFSPFEVKHRRSTVKRKILSATLKLQTLDEEGLHTLLCEAEAIINSRPITKASSDPNDLEALTPNHLLLLKTKPSLPPGRQTYPGSDGREYLPQLQERHKWSRPSRNFPIGDIVLIVDDSALRNSWVMGKVIQTVPDKFGLVRQVQIKTKTSTLDRPIRKICLLQKAE
ncbi:hypothetical protein SKAU_G00062820 [Synaphobranchus kaupii]|uniref:Integrase zinc-binding domain-containing protein n=1 Tax=Synaphobranchus kaupii TaxID=118154 RepID=A0A9Q1G686_SYNKA|nr:hypothetical protein SKAU_G00062820 [Synaphobranchus kaupii]